MILDDLGAAIEEHSHVDEDLSNDKFWENLWDKHGEEYIGECLKSLSKPSFSDFQIYCEEKGWAPDE